ncbi:hypothetical protein HYDPIDRAFT_36792 [Hydnomerulius pinastri MD-312]|nr:hypothetical protein HYDPIDRAFT_36792 [Hydnomerulius pinastri MD-312]
MKLGVPSVHPAKWVPAVPAPHLPTPHLSNELLHATEPSPVGPYAPIVTPRAEPTSQASEVVIDLNTMVTIPDFPRFYPGTPAESFQPIYYALSDGSLVAPPLVNDLRVNDIMLIITGFLLTIFLRNIWTATTYIWRGKVKKKGLLYTVFVSQLLGLVGFIPTIVAQFNRSAHCSVTMRLTVMSAGVSLSFLVTGILGVKAYKCLDNSRIVLATLVALRTAGSIVLVIDVINLESLRSLSGRCYRPSGGLSPAFVILLLAESFYICLCFLYAVWKSHGSAAVRGRIAISLSLDEVNDAPPPEVRKESTDSVHTRRGWWDYVPTLDATNPFSPQRSRQPSILSQERSIVSALREGTRGFHVGDVESGLENARYQKASVPFPSTEVASSPAPRPSTVRMSTTMEGQHTSRRDAPFQRRPTSPAFSSMSRITRYIPRMALFREVMRDELCYTATITGFTVVSAAMTLIGVSSETDINSAAWIAFDWALISLLVMHSFGRVIRRHETESLLNHPSVWYRNVYTDRSTAELLRDGGPQPSRTPGGTFRARGRRSAAHSHYNIDANDSLHDMRRLFPSSASLSSRGDLRSMTASISGTSNMLSPLQTVESLSRIHESNIGTPLQSLNEENIVSTTSTAEDPLAEGSSPFQKSPGHWYDNSLPSIPAPPEPPDEERSFHTSSYVS